jgi:antitoxin ParD1/3/4
MNVNLSPELEKLILNKVKTGEYNSASEVVREALVLLEDRDRVRDLRREEFRKQVAAGLESLRRGEGIDGEEVFDRLEAEIDAMERLKAG